MMTVTSALMANDIYQEEIIENNNESINEKVDGASNYIFQKLCECDISSMKTHKIIHVKPNKVR